MPKHMFDRFFRFISIGGWDYEEKSRLISARAVCVANHGRRLLTVFSYIVRRNRGEQQYLLNSYLDRFPERLSEDSCCSIPARFVFRRARDDNL